MDSYPDGESQGWERLADGVARHRLPGVDTTVGYVAGAEGLLVVDTGGTLREGAELARALRSATGRSATHAVLTHAHWDHCFGTPALAGAGAAGAVEPAEVYGQRGITAWLDGDALAADAERYGVDPAEAREAAAALVTPGHLVDGVHTLDLGGVTVTLLHPGPGHTDHDLAVVVRADRIARPVVFCGDLVEESGPPQAGPDAVPGAWPAALDRLLAEGGADAVYVPGHGAVVDAGFVRAQRRDLARDTTPRHTTQ